jgi:ppGpp synthetase/RelA/SpoT-type nucleotidyltranferase
MEDANQTLLEGSYSLQQYEDIIKILNNKHISHTGKWLSRQIGVTLINLKKTEVRTVLNESSEGTFTIERAFFEYMMDYQSQLIHLYAEIINEIKMSYQCNIIGRVKNEDSILNKLQKKKAEQNGAFSINKVLNDLLGFRIIDRNFEHNIKDVIEYLDDLKNNEGFRILHKERINGDYRGYHIYFMGKDAKFFPIELQIWDTNNEHINLTSHEIYKKDYTSWPEIYKKG